MAAHMSAIAVFASKGGKRVETIQRMYKVPDPFEQKGAGAQGGDSVGQRFRGNVANRIARYADAANVERKLSRKHKSPGGACAVEKNSEVHRYCHASLALGAVLHRLKPTMSFSAA